MISINNLIAALILAAAGFFVANPAKAQQITIAALGDSLVQGYGLAQSDGFVAQLERWLADQGGAVSLINAGVSGDTTAGGLARIGWTLTPAVDAVIVSLGGNDVLRGIEPAVSRENLDGILAMASERGIPVLLVGIVAPNNYGAAYKSEFEAIYPDLAEKYDAALYPNFLQALLDLPDRALVLRQYYQGDGLHPNARGVALIVDDIGPSVAALVASVADTD